MKHHSLALVAVMLVTLGAGCQSNNAPAMSPPQSPNAAAPTMPTPQVDLKTTLEQVFAQTRALANDPTPDRYLAAVDLTGSDKETVDEIKEGWANREQMLRTVMPDMTGPNAKFIEIKEEGDWAAYYYLVKISDELAILKSQRFHQVNGEWKVGTGALTRQPISAFTNFNAEALKREIESSRIMNVKP